MRRNAPLHPVRGLLALTVLLLTAAPAARAQFVPQHPIEPVPGFRVPAALTAADLDGDGDPDALAALRSDSLGDDEGRIAWFANLDGRGRFGPPQVIPDTLDEPQAVHAADLDGDGDLDLLAGLFLEDSGQGLYRTHQIAWYENLDGRGRFGERQAIATDVSSPASVHAADLDGDGDLDLLAGLFTRGTEPQGHNDLIVWYENLDGQGGFGERQVVETDPDYGGAYVSAADLDGDGDLDLLAGLAFKRRVTWYENLDGQGRFGSQHLLNTPLTSAGPTLVSAADLDGDGDLDLLGASSGGPEDPDPRDEVAWYENTGGGPSRFSEPRPLPTENRGARSASAADLDGDGDRDVLLAFWYSNEIAWYENTDGEGDFGALQVIDAEADGAEAAVPVDLDGDGDLDVLSAFCASCGLFQRPPEVNRITWYANARITSAAEPAETLPARGLHASVYPNPSAGAPTLVVALPAPAHVAVEVYDVMGRRVLSMPARPLAAGADRRIELRASSLPAGVFLYRLTARTATDVWTASGRLLRLR